MYIAVKEAVSRYNRGKPKEKMTLEKLGKLVFTEKTMTDTTKVNYLSQWNSGEALSRVRLEHIERMCQVLGVSVEQLIKIQ